MSHSPVRRLHKRARGGASAHRSVAFVVLVLFAVQLSRFFLIVPLLQVCFDLGHDHAATNQTDSVTEDSVHTHDAATGHVHDHDHLAENSDETLPAKDARFYLQHCKDTYAGMSLAPVQPLGLPSFVAYEPPVGSGNATIQESRAVVEAFLSPPFQPPRS